MLTALVSIGVSQKRAISREEFSERYSSAMERSKKFSRTHDSKRLTIVGGVVKTVTWKWIYTERFNSHLKFQEDSGKGATSFEMINIAENTFCKIGDGEWEKTEGPCDVRVPWMVTQMSWMMKSVAKSEFFTESLVESGNNRTLYMELGQIPKRKTPSGFETSPITYESLFVMDSEGRIISQEYTSFETGTKKGRPEWVDTFNYKQRNIKIAVPRVK